MDKAMMELLFAMMYGDSGEEVSTIEIDKLEKMLLTAEIPFKRYKTFRGHQICYYGPNGREFGPGEDESNCGNGVGAICSVIISSGSYGHKEGLLEISGLMTDEEYKKTGDTVLGSLTAENVFKRIERHYKTNKKN